MLQLIYVQKRGSQRLQEDIISPDKPTFADK